LRSLPRFPHLDRDLAVEYPHQGLSKVSVPFELLDGGVAVVSPAPTHAEIASRISTHREAVTREPNELARAKLIEKRGNDLIIHDIAMLESMVEDTLHEPR